MKHVTFHKLGSLCCLTNARNNQNLMGRNRLLYQGIFHGCQNSEIAAPGTPFIFIFRVKIFYCNHVSPHAFFNFLCYFTWIKRAPVIFKNVFELTYAGFLPKQLRELAGTIIFYNKT